MTTTISLATQPGRVGICYISTGYLIWEVGHLLWKSSTNKVIQAFEDVVMWGYVKIENIICLPPQCLWPQNSRLLHAMRSFLHKSQGNNWTSSLTSTRDKWNISTATVAIALTKSEIVGLTQLNLSLFQPCEQCCTNSYFNH